MKKLMLIMLIVVMLVSFGQAQIKFGVTGGINMSKLSGDDIEGAKLDDAFKSGFNGGVFLEVGLLGISLAPEVIYVKKKFEQDLEFGPNKYTITYNNDYLEIPVLLRYYFPSVLIKPYLTAGPYFATNLKDKVTTDLVSDDISSNINSMDMGLKIGAGLTLKKFGAMVRYSKGLKEVQKDGDLKQKNSSIELMLSFYF